MFEAIPGKPCGERRGVPYDSPSIAFSAILLCFRYTIGMTKFDDIYEEAVDSHGLITSARAAELGVTNNELVQYARRGRLERVGHGLYRLARRVPEDNDPYALAVALAGPGAYLFGESVIAMLGLAPTNPGRLHVAVPGRIRRRLPDGLVVERGDGMGTTAYDGISSQTAEAAIRACRGRMMPERLVQAAGAARREGYVDEVEYGRLIEEVEGL